MKKRILSTLVLLCFVSTSLFAVSIPASAATSMNFCGIELDMESSLYDNYYEGDIIFDSMDDAWVVGTEPYQGVSDYIMSTNCDKGRDGTIENHTVLDNTLYAVTFVMPYTGNINFKASNSGEDYCDFLVVLANGNEIYSTENIFNVDWTLNPWIDVSVFAKKGQKISIGYKKDVSVSNFEDRAYISELSLEDLGIVFSEEIADTEWYSEEETDFMISTKEQLAGFSLLVNEGVTFADCTISLANNIDMSGIIWTSAGQYNFELYGNNMNPTSFRILDDTLDIPGLNAYFAGTFDGKGYTINNLKCKYTFPLTTYIGFIAMNFGTIKDLELKNPIIGDGGTAKAAGAIAGYNGGVIEDCAVIGGKVDITWDNYFLAYAGGLVGTNGYAFTIPDITFLNNEGGSITRCYSSADVQVTYTRSGYFGSPNDGTELYIASAGGLLGATYGGMVTDCYAMGDVNAVAIVDENYDNYDLQDEIPVNDTFALSGGFIGMVLSAIPEIDQEPAFNILEEPAVAVITNCYATGAATATGPSAAASIPSGFLGFARNMTPAAVEPTYLLTATNCFFDTQTTGRSKGFKKAADFEGITGKTSADMKIVDTFTDWDFTDVWKRYDSINDGYPVLKGVGIGNVYTVTFTDFNDSVLKTEYISINGAAVAPANPTREGYTFISWDNTFDNVTADITVKALYNIDKIVIPTASVEGVDGTTFDEETVLVVTLITDTVTSANKNTYNFKIDALADGKELVDLFDIKLLLNNQPIQPDGSVKVKIKLTETQLTATNLQIVYIDNDGNIVIIPSTIENGYIVFVVDHFSNYGIIGTKLSVSPSTSDKVQFPIIIILLIASFGLIAVSRRKSQLSLK